MKLLFVCLGNICRSPAAENIMNAQIDQAGLGAKIVCDSAGTSSYHVGDSPDRRMTESLKKRGYRVQGRARQFFPEDFAEFDLILAMDGDNYRNILAQDPAGQYHHKVKMICDYTEKFGDREVPDPYYGGQAGFEHVIDLLEDACGNLLTSLGKELVN
ncbi:low molecular weight phosphotyrosine protein phosphatase [Synechocystis sp. PCC 6803]|jgi:protein-tyrosine phosphatase|uniref:Putative low molecular weight protein-tyrosine-phosphatase slr0328 n=1 Tax=Synechocystis sp. (strain ATCC 27184 / PCC 6803 / Kazusa) TaxID=1111708 RepID=Y328_SYNY3|nr:MULTISPECIES: low molecular weight protein-tyrosine-phosphatase [unclassified Synechocystis]Q55535.1 RecName: Full=Putative low molecular weight protein-tyrosine-phosphatase slr0328 [Synechocystis sp. PCC 6803 substr. Kazusa]AGF52326.1 low molecular weight phosphotyrosine protein phosphatase [Synechocystis sp. PCC 6803]ALJ68266.1 protein tyrosine phosphatase [Synechocystis sp. PCC 6803]AVP91331.1 protein tyrosine phosphatase [Synechocystis sp. IPPAS B-1465]MBD2618993.1 low molecular weight 